MQNLKQFLQQHFDSLDHCAESLDVSRRTVENYIYSNPTGILRHSAKIVQMKEVNPLQLFDSVGESIKEINQKQNEKH
jgi:hypothetical protein